MDAVSDRGSPRAFGTSTQRYGNVVALDDVSLDIPANKMIGLIGPDGVGKSTLLGILAGVRKIQTGEVEVLGGNIGDAQVPQPLSPPGSPTCRRAWARTSIRRCRSSRTSTSSGGCSASRTRSASGASTTCFKAPTSRRSATARRASFPAE